MISCSVESAILEIGQRFEIVGQPLRLSQVFLPTGKTELLNNLRKLRQAQFENNQRILIIQDCDDRYMIDDHAGTALTFLQQSLQTVDISNFFVIVISGNVDIENELLWLQKNYSTDSVVIGHWLTDVPYSKHYTTQESFCVNPWIHLHTSTTGEVLPCCLGDTALPVGDLKTQNLDSIINGQKMKQIRLNMLSNRTCPECVKCYEEENFGVISRRQRDNQKWAHLKDRIIAETNRDGSINKFVPKTLDLRINNICNLKCRTCSGRYSSQLAIEEKKLFNNVENFNSSLTVTQRNYIFDKISSVIDQVEKIYFAGGEPLIMIEHYAILDKLIDIDKTDLEIYYNTNFTTLNYKDKNVLDYWKKFSNIKIGASIDGHGPSLEYTRHGTVWSKIEQNFAELKEQCPHIDFTVHSTISLLSAESVMELQKMWHQQGKLDISKFNIHPVTEPYLNLQMLRYHHKVELSKKINEHCSWLKSLEAIDLYDKWNNLNTYMFAEDKTYAIKELSVVNRARDIARGESFELVYPQYQDLFD